MPRHGGPRWTVLLLSFSATVLTTSQSTDQGVRKASYAWTEELMKMGAAPVTNFTAKEKKVLEENQIPEGLWPFVNVTAVESLSDRRNRSEAAHYFRLATLPSHRVITRDHSNFGAVHSDSCVSHFRSALYWMLTLTWTVALLKALLLLGAAVDSKAENSWRVMEKSKSSYKVFDNHLSWDDAVEACRKENARLVHIYSEEENRFITDLLKGRKEQSYWIGLSRKTFSDLFKWEDGSIFDPSYMPLRSTYVFPFAYTSSICVEILTRTPRTLGKWNLNVCEVNNERFKNPYICERRSQSETQQNKSTHMTATSSQNETQQINPTVITTASSQNESQQSNSTDITAATSSEAEK